MRKTPPTELERARVRQGPYASNVGDMHGVFYLRTARNQVLSIMSSGPDDEFGWEHVSVSMRTMTPSWADMCRIKDLFWYEHEAVVQYHPAKADYVNHHPHCLHLWRPLDGVMRAPPSHLVGPKQEEAA